MPWWEFALLGAGGGAIVEVLTVFRCAAAWQDARRGCDGTIKRRPPRLLRYVDLPAHAFMLPVRVALGAATAVLFGVTGQVTGPYGAVAAGCAAPILLAQLGSIPQIAKAVNGDPRTRRDAKTRDATSSVEIPAGDTVSAGEGGMQ